MGSFIFAVSLLTQFAFLFRFAKTFMDYTASAYLIATTISISVCFMSVLFEMRKLFDIIVGFKQIIGMSKWKKNWAFQCEFEFIPRCWFII